MEPGKFLTRPPKLDPRELDKFVTKLNSKFRNQRLKLFEILKYLLSSVVSSAAISFSS